MLIQQCDFKPQRHSDSIQFNHSHHCDKAIDILENNAVHLKDKQTVIYLTEEEADKLFALRNVLGKLSAEQIENVVNAVDSNPIDVSWKLFNQWFNKRCGWFFTNGNKA